MTELDDSAPGFAVALRGYDRAQVDAYIARLEQQLEEAEERLRLSESARDPQAHSDIGPRIASIFELARAEAQEMRDAAAGESNARLNSAKREATAILEAARQRAAALSERKAQEWETKLDGFEAEREQIRLEVEALADRRAAVLAELRRLQEVLAATPGVMGDDTTETRLLVPGTHAAERALNPGPATEPATAAAAAEDPADEAETLVQRMNQAESEADPQFDPEDDREPEDEFEFADATVELPAREPSTEELDGPH